ncbi:MAG: glutamine-hydrolyzing GMP synthase, partial [Bdellovibrionales bacterium]|nr:glutamine-hydrolyzing GMP synthase [Bdellovibrionales bacterium]
MEAQLLILDFGSQVTQLIARNARELGVYCEILPGNLPASDILAKRPKAIILSGGPASVNEPGAPKVDQRVLESGLPIFGICYGMQLLAQCFGGTVTGWGTKCGASEAREFGPAYVEITNPIGLFGSFAAAQKVKVWMSHGDKVSELPSGFSVLGTSDNSPVAAFGDPSRSIYGVQFHPEVHHTECGRELIRSFLFDVAGLKADWDPSNFADSVIKEISEKVPTGNVVCGLSGGVDSTVAAVLVHKAIGERLHCIFVDNGLLRADESGEVMRMMGGLGLNVHLVDASERFLSELAGVTDPEQKRKIIGRVFIEVFEAEASRIEDVEYLVQGTLYPDVIESISVVGSSATIKSHHNVGGLIDDMKLALIEPLRELFKDEVRAIGRSLGVPEECIARQPFPGPGLAVRCLGECAAQRLEKLRIADKIVRDEVAKMPGAEEIWQSFAVL